MQRASRSLHTPALLQLVQHAQMCLSGRGKISKYRPSWDSDVAVMSCGKEKIQKPIRKSDEQNLSSFCWGYFFDNTTPTPTPTPTTTITTTLKKAERSQRKTGKPACMCDIDYTWRILPSTSRARPIALSTFSRFEISNNLGHHVQGPRIKYVQRLVGYGPTTHKWAPVGAALRA